MNTVENHVTGAHRGFAIMGAALQLAVGFLVLLSPLMAPPWGVAVLWVVWIATAVWAVRTWRRRVFGPLVAAGTMAVFWVGFINFGDLVLGWTA